MKLLLLMDVKLVILLDTKGRLGIFEAIYNDASIQNIIPSNPSEREIEMVANKQGILNMKDGIAL